MTMAEENHDLTVKAKEVATAEEALRLLSEWWECLGGDPYYRDIYQALGEMVERLAPKKKP